MCHKIFIFFFYRNPSSINLSQSFGFIFNVPIDYTVGVITLPLKRRHWIAIKKINGKYWNLDSKLDVPQNLGNVILILFLYF